MKILKEIFEWIIVLVVSVALYFLINTFVASNFSVKGHSMDYTFADNDKVIVSKVNKIDRGDTIVFHANANDDYIKRVIGMPGDTIEYKNDTLYINGKKQDEPYLDEKKKEFKKESSENLTPDFNIEFLRSTTAKTVPADSYFVMGDNRRNSTDSRAFGFVKKDKVIGQVVLRFYPFKSVKTF